MSLIACSECGHQVSTAAAACPSCGRPMAPQAKPPAPRNKFLGEMDVVRAIGTILILGMAVLAIFTCHPS